MPFTELGIRLCKYLRTMCISSEHAFGACWNRWKTYTLSRNEYTHHGDQGFKLHILALGLMKLFLSSESISFVSLTFQ